LRKSAARAAFFLYHTTFFGKKKEADFIFLLPFRTAWGFYEGSPDEIGESRRQKIGSRMFGSQLNGY